MHDRRLRFRHLAAGIAAAFSAPAFALPTAPAVASGSASFSQSGGTLAVTNTPNAIINWGSFSIGRNEVAKFVQQSGTSAVLNRVAGQDPSLILGQLQSNGRVFLINPNGIVFGAGSSVDTAGLIASTLKLSDADFLAGRMRFTGSGTEGKLANQGTINVASGGFVYLIAPEVENGGIVSSPNGDVLLAAGRSVEVADGLNPALRTIVTAPEGTVVNLGKIFAEAGRIGLHAGIVSNAGTISAASAVAEGGKIYLRATDRIALAATSKLGADGTTGGEISAIVGKDGLIGGELIGRGEISAQGNGAAGSGGFVETSAAKVDVNGIGVRTKGGTWLIDPNDFTIAASGGDIAGATLSANLGSNNVTILSSSGSTVGNGDINVNDAVSWNANTTLALSAYRNVNVNSNITATGNTAGLVLSPNNTGLGGGSYSLNNGAVITLSGATPSLTIQGIAYTVINDVTALQNMSNNLARRYALGSDIDASATSTWNTGAGFVPVGNTATGFTGVFDGLNHTITGLTINRPGQSYIGLFGVTNSGVVVIRNVGLVGVNITGYKYVGGLVGSIGGDPTWMTKYPGTITNSYVTGSVTGAGDTGGLVGYMFGNSTQGKIDKSYATARVTGSTGYLNYYLGGLVGENDGGTVGNSYATGAVDGVNGGNDFIGGLVGSNAGTIANAYATGAVAGNTANVGGLMGVNYGSVTSSYWDTNTSGRANCAGSGSGAGCTGLPTGQMKLQASFSGWDFTNIWHIDNGLGYPLLKSFLAPLTVSAAAANKTYDGLPYSGGNGISYSGFTRGDTAIALGGTLAYGGAAQGAINAGNYSIVPSGYSSTKYIITYVNGALTISPAPLTVTGVVADNKVYDGTTNATISGSSVPSLSGLVAGEALTLGYPLVGVFADKNAGTGKVVTASGYSLSNGTGLASNYQLSSTSVTTTANITPAPLTITANNASKTYDRAAYAGGNGVGYTGFVNGETSAVLTGTLAYGGTSQGAINAGSYSIVPSGYVSNKYIISYVNGVLTISAATPPSPPASPPSSSAPATSSSALVPPAVTNEISLQSAAVVLGTPRFDAPLHDAVGIIRTMASVAPAPLASGGNAEGLSEAAAALAPIFTQVIRDTRNEEPNYGTCLVCRR